LNSSASKQCHIETSFNLVKEEIYVLESVFQWNVCLVKDGLVFNLQFLRFLLKLNNFTWSIRHVFIFPFSVLILLNMRRMKRVECLCCAPWWQLKIGMGSSSTGLALSFLEFIKKMLHHLPFFYLKAKQKSIILDFAFRSYLECVHIFLPLKQIPN